MTSWIKNPPKKSKNVKNYLGRTSSLYFLNLLLNFLEGVVELNPKAAGLGTKHGTHQWWLFSEQELKLQTTTTTTTTTTTPPTPTPTPPTNTSKTSATKIIITQQINTVFLFGVHSTVWVWRGTKVWRILRKIKPCSCGKSETTCKESNGWVESCQIEKWPSQQQAPRFHPINWIPYIWMVSKSRVTRFGSFVSYMFTVTHSNCIIKEYQRLNIYQVKFTISSVEARDHHQ